MKLLHYLSHTARHGGGLFFGLRYHFAYMTLEGWELSRLSVGLIWWTWVIEFHREV